MKYEISWISAVQFLAVHCMVNDKCFALVKVTHVNWLDAETYCANHFHPNGHLASMHTDIDGLIPGSCNSIIQICILITLLAPNHEWLSITDYISALPLPMANGYGQWIGLHQYH